MTRLFDVPSGRRVRVTSKRVRYAEVVDGERVVRTLLEDYTWTGTTTGHYWIFEGVERRLITDHDIECGKLETDIWQRDVDCYVVG